MSENSVEQVDRQIALRQQSAMANSPAEQQENRDLISSLRSGGLRESHGFRGDAMEVWNQIALASADDVIDGDDKLNTTINIVNYYAHECDITDKKTFEVNRVVRTVLYDEGGKRYAFVSSGIGQDLVRLCATFGPAPWQKPIPVQAKRIKTSGGFHIMRLQPASTK